MKTGKYRATAAPERLQNEYAILRQDPDKEENYLAQFNSFHTNECYGWHSFPKVNFVWVKGNE
jgi:hypothetical protein